MERYAVVKWKWNGRRVVKDNANDHRANGNRADVVAPGGREEKENGTLCSW